MSVWYCIPSARPDGGTLREWKDRGYKLAVFRDDDAPELPFQCDSIVTAKYPGYAKAVNCLISFAMRDDPSCEWFVTGGDDTLPDMAHSPEEIAGQLTAHFGGTFGVCQFTGDRWGDDPYSRRKWPDAPAMIDRIAGSPWIGREFARRMYGGVGPLWEGYWHNWEDEELKCVAEKLGVYWTRRDLIHFHDHPLRKAGGQWPEHLKGASADYEKMKPVFEERKRLGFPGHEPIA